MLLVISGLPGVGKSTIAAAVAAELSAVHLSVDTMEDAILGAGLVPSWTTGVAAYEAVRAAAEQNLAIGHTVVVDAVNDSSAARRTWSNAAAATGLGVRWVLLIPPPRQEHQLRLGSRDRGLNHVPEPTWEQVAAREEAFEPWDGWNAVVDSAQSINLVVTEVMAVANSAA